MTDIPHLALPPRIDPSTGSLAVNEQDTNADIADCVELTLRTVQGQRRTLPSFGRPEMLEFIVDRDLAVSLVQQAIELAEPRARPAVEAAPIDTTDPGLLRLLAFWELNQEETS
jgi:phage baseplate assembly protein W